jgi:predicted transcriptional regulator
MKDRRTKFEIINYFLDVIKIRKSLGLGKTMLMQKTNLSPQGFKKYLNMLIEKELITPNKKMCLTEKGEDYLKKSKLLLLKIDKLNKEYLIDLDKIKY